MKCAAVVMRRSRGRSVRRSSVTVNHVGPSGFRNETTYVVGVFFTPRGYFNFTGGGSYTATAAQFWTDQMNVNGGASVGLIPDSKFAVEAPIGAVGLIR